MLQGNPGYLQICIQSLHALMDPRLHRSAASRRLTWVYFNWIEYVNVVQFFLLQNGKWNGLMAELVEKKFDMVLTSLKVNSEREAAVDFTSPFLESGTTILVARRTGIISPTGRSLTQLSSVFFSH